MDDFLELLKRNEDKQPAKNDGLSETEQKPDDDSENDKSPSLNSAPHADKSNNLQFSVTRNRRSNNNLEDNAVLGSVFQYNDQIMRNLLKSQTPKPLSYARSHFFLNLLKPLNRRTIRYSGWDDHSVMHFGKRSPMYEEYEEDSFMKRAPYPISDHSGMHFGKRFEPEEDAQDFEEKRSPDSWSEHQVMHFGKRSLESDESSSIDKESVQSSPEQSVMQLEGEDSISGLNDDNEFLFEKRDDPWHNVMNFGKKSENFLSDHRKALFNKQGQGDPWYNLIRVDKKGENPWDHSTMHFGKKDDPWHNIMSFGKKSENPWDHNTLHFGKRDEVDPWHSMMSFGKRSENLWDHNTMHFGKKDEIDPWHSMMSFGKKSDKFWDHSTMHFGKRDGIDTWHNMMNFGKKSENPWDHNTMHFGKREMGDPWHNMMSFGKKSEIPWDHNTMHFGKRDVNDPWHSMMSFGKKSENRRDNQSAIYYDKSEDNTPWHSMMSFGKKAGNPWDQYSTLQFRKRDDEDPWHNMMSFGKKSEYAWNNHDTMHFGKRDIDDPWHSMMSFGKKSNDMTNILDAINYEKKADPWENHHTMHFGKRLNENFTQDTSHDDSSTHYPYKHREKRSVKELNSENADDLEGLIHGKRADPWESHNTMHFGKKADSWDHHNTLHFGKKSNYSQAVNPKLLEDIWENPWDNQRIPGEKKNSLWESHNTLHFGKKFDDSWENHNTMHFGKKLDPWESHNTMHFGKKSDPWENHNTMHFGKKSEPWENHNTMHFGKKSDPWENHNTMHFGKKSDPWENHNTMHFGKKSEPWENHNTMHFGKKSDPWENHNTMHFGKKSDQWGEHNTMHFGKKSDSWVDHNTMHFGKRSEPWANHHTMHFGKKSDLWDHHNTMHFGKKSNEWENHNTMHFGKKFDPWENHNTMHFGKRFDNTEQNSLLPEIRENLLENNFTKETLAKSDDLKRSNETSSLENGFNSKALILKKRSIRKLTNNNNYYIDNKKRENITLESVMQFAKSTSSLAKDNHTRKANFFQKPINSIESRNKLNENAQNHVNKVSHISSGMKENNTTDSMWHDTSKNITNTENNNENKVRVNKRSIESDTLQNNNPDSTIGKQNQDFEILEEYPDEEPLDAVLHFGKRSADYNNAGNNKRSENPWDAHSVLHFGKRSEDPWESHNTMHFGKKSDPWENHSTLHFGKKFDPWENHGTLHFGKKSDPWESHGTLHFGKKSDPWENHSTLHFGKKSSPFREHDTLHFGKRNNPWENHSTMHFGKRFENSRLPENVFLLATDEQEKLNKNMKNYIPNDLESTNQARIINNLKELISFPDTKMSPQWMSENQISSLLRNSLEKIKLRELRKDLQLQPSSNNVIQSLFNEENSDILSKKSKLLKQYLKQLDIDEPLFDRIMNQYIKNRERIDASDEPIVNKDDVDNNEDSSMDYIYKWLLDKSVSLDNDDPEEEDKFDYNSNMYPKANSYTILPSAPRQEWLNDNGVSKSSFKMKRKFMREPEYKRYWAPFQGPKSIVYPHAWFASQIRRSVLPTSIIVPRSYETRMTEKKEDPVNSFMHFGRR